MKGAAAIDGIVHPLGCECVTCTSLPMIYASQPREITPEMQQMAKDAERYRKIKNSQSPFVVMYYGSRLLPDGRNRTQSTHLLTGEMDAMVDSWPEEEHDV